MRFIVTGSPRSATRYAALLFKAMDVPCSHEHVLVPQALFVDALRWYEQDCSGESSWLAWAFLGSFPDDIIVFHSRRNPWNVIDSLAHRNPILAMVSSGTDHQQRMRDAIRIYCPRVFEYNNTIDRAAALLLDWDGRIMDAAIDHDYYDYCVERLSVDTVRRMLSLLQITRPDECIHKALDAIPRDANIGRKVEHNVTITDPHVLRYLEHIAPGKIPLVKRITPTQDGLSPGELTDRMDPCLRDGVQAYARQHGYDDAS